MSEFEEVLSLLITKYNKPVCVHSITSEMFIISVDNESPDEIAMLLRTNIFLGHGTLSINGDMVSIDYNSEYNTKV